MRDPESGDTIPDTVSDDSVGDTCFVCLEGGDLQKSRCECQILAHPNCLLKCIDRSRSLECTVCKTSYANIYFEIISSRRVSPTLLMVLASAIVVILTCVGAGSVTTTTRTHWGNALPLRDVMLLFFGFMIMGSLCSFFKFAKGFQSEGAKCCIETRVSKARYVGSVPTRTRFRVSSGL